MALVKTYVSKMGNIISIYDDYCLKDPEEIKKAWERVEEIASQGIYETAVRRMRMKKMEENNEGISTNDTDRIDDNNKHKRNLQHK